MCKINLAAAFGKNSLRKGLFQLIQEQGYYLDPIKDFSIINSDQSSHKCDSEIKERKNWRIETQILSWLEGRKVLMGNPQNLVYQSAQRQKAIIVPQKERFNGFWLTNSKMSNLLAKRAAKQYETKCQPD